MNSLKNRPLLSKFRPLVTAVLVSIALVLGWMLVRKWQRDAFMLAAPSNVSVNTQNSGTSKPNAALPTQPQQVGIDSNLSKTQKEMLKGKPQDISDLNGLLVKSNDAASHYRYLMQVFKNKNRIAFDAYSESFPNLPEVLIEFLEQEPNRTFDLMFSVLQTEDARLIKTIADLPSMSRLKELKGRNLPITPILLKAINTNDSALFRSIEPIPSATTFHGVNAIQPATLPSFADDYMEYIVRSPSDSISKLADDTFSDKLFRTELLKSNSPVWARAFSKCSAKFRIEFLPSVIEAKNKQVAIGACSDGFDPQDSKLRWLTSKQEIKSDPASVLNTIEQTWPGCLKDVIATIPVARLAPWWEADLQSCSWLDHRERLAKWLPVCKGELSKGTKMGLGGRDLQTMMIQEKPWLIPWVAENNVVELKESIPEVQFYLAVKNRDRVRISEMLTVHFTWSQPGRIFSPELFLIQERDEDGLRNLLKRKFTLTHQPNTPSAISAAFRVCRDSNGKLEPAIPTLLAEHGAIESNEVLWELLSEDSEAVFDLFEKAPAFTSASANFLPQLIVVSMSRRKPTIARKLFAALMSIEQNKRLASGIATPSASLDDFLITLQKDLYATKTADLCLAAVESPELIEDFLLHGISFSYSDLLFATEKKKPESVLALLRDPNLQLLTVEQLNKLKDRAKSRGDQVILSAITNLEAAP